MATLMRRMGIEPLFPKKKLSRPAPGHKIYPYLLRNLEVIQPGAVWCADITYLPLARGVKISRDGRGRWLDNVFIERLWRSVKYEEVYLYNMRRRHQGLGNQIPDEVYWSTLCKQEQAAR